MLLIIKAHLQCLKCIVRQDIKGMRGNLTDRAKLQDSGRQNKQIKNQRKATKLRLKSGWAGAGECE